jgi:hypothetical protein
MVIARNIGRLGNRLILFSHFIALAREYGVSLANPCFAEYASLFPSTCHNLFCRYDERRSLEVGRPLHPWRRVLARESVYVPARIATHLRLTNYPVRILRLERGERLDLQSRSVIEAIQNRSVVLFMGWQFRCYPLVLQHADAIRDFFRWDDATDSRVRDFMARARQNCDRLVGVHVRRGDYASFASGRYFFNDLQYARWMRQVIEQNNGRRIRFMICSDSAWDESAYNEFDCITGPGEMIEDMSALSHCDLIVGPPSTFTGWASFVGSVPCQHFHQIDERFQESECEIYNLSEPRSLLFS